MKKQNFRFDRIEKLLVKTINNLISFRDIKALKGFDRVFIIKAIPSRDLSSAKVYYAIQYLDGEKEQKEILIDRVQTALTQAKGYIQMQISSQLDTHSIPRLYFQYDREYERASNVQEKIEEIKKERENGE